jgi:hypothetical protein
MGKENANCVSVVPDRLEIEWRFAVIGTNSVDLFIENVTHRFEEHTWRKRLFQKTAVY